jgi:hypothetical protein
MHIKQWHEPVDDISITSASEANPENVADEIKIGLMLAAAFSIVALHHPRW